MFLILFSLFWGGFIAVLLCAPYSYYPLLFILLAISFATLYISKKHINFKKKYFYILSILFLILSYSLCSYMIFKSPKSYIPKNIKVSKDKEAVIFYCEGEMEKYTPYYSSCFIKNTPAFFKPFKCLSIKKYYRKISVNEKNKTLSQIASETKNSLLNYKPYYFYIAFSSYYPTLNDSLIQALKDECSKITIINYSNNISLQKESGSILESFNKVYPDIKISFSKPVCSSSGFSDIFVDKISNMENKWDGLLIIDDNTECSREIKSKLVNLGTQEDHIEITKDIDGAMKHFSSSGFKNILYIDLTQSGGGLHSEIIVPQKLNKYSKNLKITGIKDWGYDKRFIKCTLDTFLEAEGK